MHTMKLSVGGPIEARCTKCREITNHTIVAMTASGPAKVQCNTCSGQHKYRPAAPVKKAPARRTVNPKISEQNEWAELQPGMSRELAKEYTMTTAFKVGSLMNHPLFGLGIVQRLSGPQKVEVLFESGKKTMRCK